MTPTLADVTRGESRPARLFGRLVAGASLGAIAWWWAMRDVELPLVRQTLMATSPFWLVLALLGVVAVVLVKAARWGVLYGPPVASFGSLFSVLAAAQMVNLIIPIRLGEVVRIAGMKQAGQPAAATLTTIIVEKGLDVATTGSIAAALLILTVTPPWLRAQMVDLTGIGLTLLGGLVLFWFQRRRVASGLVLIRWLPPRWRPPILAAGQTMAHTFNSLATPSTLGWVLLWTLTAWLLSLLTMLALFAAFRLALPLTAAIVMMLAVHSSNILPSPPALVGLMQALAVVVLPYYGVPRSEALGFGIVLNIVTVAPLIGLGSGALLLRLAPLRRFNHTEHSLPGLQEFDG